MASRVDRMANNIWESLVVSVLLLLLKSRSSYVRFAIDMGSPEVANAGMHADMLMFLLISVKALELRLYDMLAQE